jgi:hypothetical protein
MSRGTPHRITSPQSPFIFRRPVLSNFFPSRFNDVFAVLFFPIFLRSRLTDWPCGRAELVISAYSQKP